MMTSTSKSKCAYPRAAPTEILLFIITIYHDRISCEFINDIIYIGEEDAK